MVAGRTGVSIRPGTVFPVGSTYGRNPGSDQELIRSCAVLRTEMFVLRLFFRGIERGAHQPLCHCPDAGDGVSCSRTKAGNGFFRWRHPFFAESKAMGASAPDHGTA